MEHIIGGRSLEDWQQSIPELQQILHYGEVLWINPKLETADIGLSKLNIGMPQIQDAQARLERFAPLFAQAFPETAESGGIIESPLVELSSSASTAGGRASVGSLSVRGEGAGSHFGEQLQDPRLMVKMDSNLPISGSIKARGGIYEVIHFAEQLALSEGIISASDDRRLLLGSEARALFADYRIVAGSTGNLGLSIGIMGAALGFSTVIHMSHDARQWKKDLLRQKGVQVVEHSGDYGAAVAQARQGVDAKSHFIDDENSLQLFLGYSVAALRLQTQLASQGIFVDEQHPLFVYLPCGVGGGPGGVAFGLKQVFGDHVHCFFAEPTHSPCMLLGLATGLHENVSVSDFGLDNRTAADGLAVGRPSGFVGKTIGSLISGCYTVDDATLFAKLKALKDAEDIAIEPSAAAGLVGPQRLFSSSASKGYLSRFSQAQIVQSTHIAWLTGGGMVPEHELREYYEFTEQISL